MTPSGSASFPPHVNRYTFIPFLEDLFQELENSDAERPNVATFRCGGRAFTFQCSNADVFDTYLNRLAVERVAMEPEQKIFVVAAEDMGWTPTFWNDPDWHPHRLGLQLAAAGYDIDYPKYDNQWIVHDRRHARSVYYLHRMSERLPWDSGAPLRLPLHWVFKSRDVRMVHSGSLGNGKAGCLLSGPGGAGKSGTVLAGIAFGLQTAGDDYVLLDQRGAPNLSSIYRIMKQDSGGISRIAGLQERLGRVRENWQGKFEFDLDGVFPNCRVASMPLDAVIMPRITHSDRSTFDAVTRQDAINRLTRSMVSELPDDPRQILIAFAKLTNRVPTFAMNLSESPKEIAATLARFLERGGP